LEASTRRTSLYGGAGDGTCSTGPERRYGQQRAASAAMVTT